MLAGEPNAYPKQKNKKKGASESNVHKTGEAYLGETFRECDKI